MSSFTCEQCGKSIVDDGGYITECEHYPMEGNEMKDELGERLDTITEPQEWIDALVSSYAPLSRDIDVAIQNMGLEIKDLKAERDTLKADNEALRHKPGINLCSCKSIEDCDANSDAADEWCRVDYNSGIFEQALQGGNDAK